MKEYGLGIVAITIFIASVLFVIFIRKTHREKYRFINEKGDEIKDQSIINLKKKEIEEDPLVQDRSKEIAENLDIEI